MERSRRQGRGGAQPEAATRWSAGCQWRQRGGVRGASGGSAVERGVPVEAARWSAGLGATRRRSRGGGVGRGRVREQGATRRRSRGGGMGRGRVRAQGATRRVGRQRGPCGWRMGRCSACFAMHGWVFKNSHELCSSDQRAKQL